MVVDQRAATNTVRRKAKRARNRAAKRQRLLARKV